VVIVGLVAWTAFRALGARPPETPKVPFPAPAIDVPLAAAKSRQTAVLAEAAFGACRPFSSISRGVSSVTSGYSGGHVKSPSYESVSVGVNRHAETVSIIMIRPNHYGQLLMVFFSVAHGSHAVESPGPGHRLQYRSAIFYTNEDQKRIAQAYIAQLERGESLLA